VRGRGDGLALGLLVVEVSSFQLEFVERLKPFVATWLNLTPDHLERHRDLATYAGLKARLFEHQDEDDYAVWNADDPEVAARRTQLRRVPGPGRANALEFSRASGGRGGAPTRRTACSTWRGGRHRAAAAARGAAPARDHNLANALAALASVLPLEPAPDLMRAVLREYGGLEHRLEWVAEIEGVRFVNDSKATNLSSLEVALKSFREPVVLIAGGRDKGQDFAPLRALARRRGPHRGADRRAPTASRKPGTASPSCAPPRSPRRSSAPSRRRVRGQGRGTRRGRVRHGHRAALAGLRLVRHVPRLRRPRPPLQGRGGAAQA